MGKRVIDLHVIGEKLEFNDARERTGGRRSEGTVTLGPGRNGPGAHRHTRQIETFEVISGTLTLVADGQVVSLRKGESFAVQPGASHTFRNEDPVTPAVAKFSFEPALNAEWMLQTLGEWAMDRGGDWKKVPPLPACYMMWLLRGEYRLAGIPTWLQDVLFGLLAVVARISGQARHVRIPGDPNPASVNKSK